MAEEKLPDANDIKIVGIFGSTRTTPDGPSFVYAEINDIFDFVEYDRRDLFKLDKESSDATIDAVKKTMLDRGYLFDIGESYKSSIAFPVMLGMNGRIQIGEGNHRLRAALEISQETGKKVYVPIYAYPMGTVQYGGIQLMSGNNLPYRGRSRFVGEQTLYDALRQLLFDAGASEYTVNEKIGETLGANKGYAGSNYLGAGGSGGSEVSQENVKKFFDAIGVETLTYEELPEDNVYKTGVNNLTDTTNVVDEGIELLFHGRGKGSRVPENLHAGTYQAAVDRNAFMFGSENMYEMIYEIKEDFVNQVTEALENIELDDGTFYTTEYLQPEVYLPNGNTDTYDIRIDVLEDGTVDVVLGKDGEEIATVFNDSSAGYVIDDLEDGVSLYSQIDQEGLEDIIQNRDVDKYFGEAGGFLDPDRSFKYEDGYELYRVTISPNAKVVEFTDNITMTINGKLKFIDPDIFVNYLESGNLEGVEGIQLPNETNRLRLSGSNKEKINTIKQKIDVIGYRNQMEDVGSTSYYFLNKDVYNETLVGPETNKNYNNDVLKKFVENDPYKDLAAFDTAPIDRQRLAKKFMGEVEDIADGLPLLETRMNLGDGPLSWGVDTIKSNKIFNPDKWTKLVTPEGEPHSGLDDPGKYVWNDTPEFNASEWYSRVITNNATDEDITKFFIYLASHSETSAYARQQFKNADAIADIVKIGIFSDLPIDQIIPMGQPYFEARFIEELKINNSLIGDEIYKVLVNLVNEQGQFANLKETMRNVILEAHRDIYAANPNDYFIVWRGGDLNRFVPWQSTSKNYKSAQGIMYQMVQGGYGGGRSVDTYVVHKNNMIDLDAIGLSYSNEKEIIVLTEELKSPLAKRPTTIEGRKDLRNIKDWWLLARTKEDAFPKDGKEITNLSKRLTDAGQATQEFFSDVIDGIDPRYKPQKPYQQIIELNNPKLYAFQDDYNVFIKGGGNFNQHIFTSIPTFYETQVAKMQGITNMIEKNKLVADDLFDRPIISDVKGPRPYRILDIGGTEGAWAKALAKNNPLVNIEVLDPNRAAKLAFESGDIVTNAKFLNQAFTHVVEDQGKMFVEGGVTEPVKFLVFDNENPPLKNANRWDIVHESMAFQFISSERAKQIKYIKENVLTTNGVLIIEEKFLDDSQAIYDANEIQKNNFKSQYYTQEQLADKKLNVLLDMEGNQISVQEVQKILGENFNHVEQYWDAGNFKGFVASDDAKKVEDFTNGINDVGLSLTNHTYSTAPTDTDIKGALEKKMFNNGTDSKLAGQIAEETVKQNPNFFKRAAQTINNFDSTLASIKLLGRLGVVAAPVLNTLARTAPLYAPGDVILEKTIDKVVPYLDDAAAKLGLGRIPFNKLLPTYMAYEIGVAGADLVQAAMYAYETAAKNNQPGNFQIGLTKLLLPKAYEEEAIKKSQMPGDLQAFYNTPTGQKVAEELDFGSQFLKELENEKVSKYSPGWGLTKGIFSMLGDLYKAGQNPSDYTTKYRDSRASMYNVGFTGSNR